jgi:hypothetical protein
VDVPCAAVGGREIGALSMPAMIAAAASGVSSWRAALNATDPMGGGGGEVYYLPRRHVAAISAVLRQPGRGLL